MQDHISAAALDKGTQALPNVQTEGDAPNQASPAVDTSTIAEELPASNGKVCKACSVWKHLSEFHRNKGGYRTTCKDCLNSGRREKHKKQAEQVGFASEWQKPI